MGRDGNSLSKLQSSWLRLNDRGAGAGVTVNSIARKYYRGVRISAWESLYSPMLKYGSYRSRDLKLRHRERCVRERPGSG